MRVPSGDQSGLFMSTKPFVAELPSGRRLLPSAFITYACQRSELAAFCRRTEIRLPSGDHSAPFICVNGTDEVDRSRIVRTAVPSRRKATRRVEEFVEASTSLPRGGLKACVDRKLKPRPTLTPPRWRAVERLLGSPGFEVS